MEEPKIDPEIISKIKQQINIVDIIGEYIVLNEHSRDLTGFCPFGLEMHPGFTVSPKYQMYYCFRCKSGGDAIKFLMNLHELSFSEVVSDLASRLPEGA